MAARSLTSASTDVSPLAHGHGRADAAPSTWNVLRFVVAGGVVDVTLSGSVTSSASADGNDEPGVAYTRTLVSIARLVGNERDTIVEIADEAGPLQNSGSLHAPNPSTPAQPRLPSAHGATTIC